MASTTFPLAQSGLLTIADDASPGPAVTGFKVLEARHVNRQQIRVITGNRRTGAGAWAQDAYHHYAHGVPADDFVIDAVVETSHTYALSQTSNLTYQTSTIKKRASSWTLTKVTPLDPVHGANNANTAEWVHAIPTYQFRDIGWATASGPGSTTQEERITIAADEIGTIEWNTAHSAGENDGNLMKVTGQDVRSRFVRGGHVPASLSGLMQGDVAYSAGNNDWSWLFSPTGSDATAPQKVTMTLDTDGESLAKSVMIYNVSLTWTATVGGPVYVRMLCRWDKA